MEAKKACAVNNATSTGNFIKEIKTFCNGSNLNGKKENKAPIIKNGNRHNEKSIPMHYIELNDEDGRMFECEVVLVVNPSEFYIRPLCASNEDYQTMQENMLKYYESNVMSRRNKNDNITAVRYKSNFYRASRISSFQNENVMYLIDLGIYQKISSYDIFKLAEPFYELPAKLIQCSLFGVETNTKDKKWSPKSIEWFKNEIKRHDSLLVGVQYEIETLEMYEVKFFFFFIYEIP